MLCWNWVSTAGEYQARFFPQVLSEQTACETLLLCNTVEVFLKLNSNYFDKTRDIQRNSPCFVSKLHWHHTPALCPPIRHGYFLDLRVCWIKETAGWTMGLMLGPCYSKSHFCCCLDDEKCKKEFITGSLRLTHHRFYDSVYWITFMPARWALQMTRTRGIRIAQSQD